MHNPLPRTKVEIPLYDVMPLKPYTPYVGTLGQHMVALIESNSTVPPYNYAFALISVANVRRVDPRPKSMWVTELERVWSGASARYWPDNGTLLLPGLELEARNCSDYIYYGYLE